jgi:uridylate kinase
MLQRSRWRAKTRFPIVVFSIHEKGAFAKIMVGGGRATIVRDH